MTKNTTLELLEDNLNKHMEICDLKRKVKRLTAENKRLRKAGNDLERDLFLRMNLNAPMPSSIAEWNSAKEGKDAK